VSKILTWVVLFVCLLGLTAFCSFIGDDDVVYQYMDRKPTPREGIIRIRWVMLKALTSIFGGGVLGIAIDKFLSDYFSFDISKNQAGLTALACFAVVGLLIGVLQNEIRRARGRPSRPLIDGAVWRRNFQGPQRGKR
jgi:hypothetical protein